MDVNPFAGKPTEPPMLINVPRLVTAHYIDGLTMPCRNNGLLSAPRDIVVRHSKRLSTKSMAKEQKMKKATAITCMFLDIGGVLLTNGWDHLARKRAARSFELDWTEMEDRHHLTFGAHEEGKLTLEEYLSKVVFYQKRQFTRTQFRSFMRAQSKPYPEIMNMIRDLRAKYGLKIVTVSNEGRELNAYRIRKFKLDRFVDSFISSCFVHLRKPDVEILRLALDIAQVRVQQIVYIENTPMFVQIAEGLGIRSILHTDYNSTRAKLASLGFNK